jgi:serine/threonine-protein kinase RsbW
MSEFSTETMRVPAVLENLRVIRRFVGECGSRAGFARPRLDDLILAVDEAATNIMLHGYKGWSEPASPVVEVEVLFRDPVLAVFLRDQAPPFDPTATATVDKLPPLAERGPGGLGIFLIRKTMDEFRYRRTADGWNELVLAIYRVTDPQEEQ